jgi:hypothetical protein
MALNGVRRKFSDSTSGITRRPGTSALNGRDSVGRATGELSRTVKVPGRMLKV